MTRHHNRGYVLLMVLGTLFVMGFIALDNARYLTDSIQWQSHLHSKRLRLDWQLESAINCLAIHTVSPQTLPTERCLNDDITNVSMAALESKNQFRLQADQQTIASSAVLQLGELEEDVAIASNLPLPQGLLGSSVLVEPSVISRFFGYESVDTLKERWGGDVGITSKENCGGDLLLHGTTGSRSLVIDGDCSISADHWRQLTLLSSSAPFFLLFVGGDLTVSGSHTLQGVIAVWHSQADSHRVTVVGSPKIEGGLFLELSHVPIMAQGGMVVVENQAHLETSRFSFSKRQWLVGSWRDFE